MKYFLMLLCLASTTAFASEIESQTNACDDVVASISKKYRELSEISSRMVVLGYDGPEVFSVDYRENEDCETVLSDYQILNRRKEKLEQELVTLRLERKRVCPRVYPE